MSKKCISLFYKAITNSYAKIPIIRFVIVPVTERTPNIHLAKQPSASLSRFPFTVTLCLELMTWFLFSWLSQLGCLINIPRPVSVLPWVLQTLLHIK